MAYGWDDHADLWICLFVRTVLPNCGGELERCSSDREHFSTIERGAFFFELWDGGIWGKTGTSVEATPSN